MTVTGAKVSRKESGFGKLFRYDYEELGEPLHLTLELQVDFVTELYDVASEELVWSSETEAPKSDNIQALVDRVLGGQGLVIHSPIMPQSWAYLLGSLNVKLAAE